MRKFKIFAVTLLFASVCNAQQLIPTTPNINGTGGSVKSKDGANCTQGTKSTPIVDFGLTASPPPDYLYYQNNASQEMRYGLFARVVIPFGGSNNAIDCSEMYYLEIERLRIELDKARQNKDVQVIIR